MNLHISELNSAIAFLSLESGIALFSSEMCRGASKSTSHPQTMSYIIIIVSLRHSLISYVFYLIIL